MTTNKIKVTDLTGNVLSKGDQVAYPVRKGSNMWMEQAEILSINMETTEQGRPQIVASIKKANGRTYQLTNFGRCVKLSVAG